MGNGQDAPRAPGHGAAGLTARLRTGLTQWPPGPYLAALARQYADAGAVDLAFVIDATGSMSGLIETVKANALDAERQLREALRHDGQALDSLRVRVVVFRDLYCDSSPLETTPFLDLPGQARRFRDEVGRVVADGGGDEPESGLEGLALAIRSSWGVGQQRRRGVIVLWTDASAHPLERRSILKKPVATAGLPRSFHDLTTLWREMAEPMGGDLRRLLLFAPAVEPWTTIAATWPQVVHRPSRPGGGLDGIDFGGIVETIVGGLKPLRRQARE
jgi:hypothetical protein